MGRLAIPQQTVAAHSGGFSLPTRPRKLVSDSKLVLERRLINIAPDADSDDLDSCQEIGRVLIVTCGDATIVFDAIKEPLDQISLAI